MTTNLVTGSTKINIFIKYVVSSRNKIFRWRLSILELREKKQFLVDTSKVDGCMFIENLDKIGPPKGISENLNA